MTLHMLIYFRCNTAYNPNPYDAAYADLFLLQYCYS